MMNPTWTRAMASVAKAMMPRKTCVTVLFSVNSGQIASACDVPAALEDADLGTQELFRVFPDVRQQIVHLDDGLVQVVIQHLIVQQLAGRSLPVVQIRRQLFQLGG